MKQARLLLLSAAVILLVVISGIWDGRTIAPAALGARLSVPSIGTASDVSSTWFCTAGSAAVEPAPHHQLFITNSGTEETDVRVTAYGAEGAVGAKESRVEAGGIKAVDLAKDFGVAGLSAMVEAPHGAVAVTHWLLSETMGDAAPCQRESSPNWYFPSQTTLAGATARLVLFNPFPADAGVDVTAASADRIHSPTEWAGIVVPAGTNKVVDLSEFVQRRDQFSVTVKVRSGSVFAETSQTFSGVAVPPSPSVTGLVLGSPVAAPQTRWTFAGGFKDAGASESIVVQNPGTSAITVRIQVIPYGSSEMTPEPFELRVPARRFAVLDLTEEGRIPDIGYHAITVESDQRHPIVVQRRNRLSALPEETSEEATFPRVSLSKGAAADTGFSGSARHWVLTSALTGEPNAPLAFVHNSGDKPAKITMSGVDDSGKEVVLAEGELLEPSEGVAVQLSTGTLAEARMRSYKLSASEPVIVEQLITMNAIPDFAMMPAFPVAD